MFKLAGMKRTGCDRNTASVLGTAASDVAVEELATGPEPLSRNATSFGALETLRTQTKANPATSDTADFQARPAPAGRLPSRICATRSDVWRIRPSAACANAMLR